MTLQMILIYASGGALISLMAAFAAHNRKTGWKRERPNLLEALNELYADLGVSATSPVGAVPMVVHSSRPASEFSQQLLALRGALGSSSPISMPRTRAREVSSEVHQLVNIGSRR